MVESADSIPMDVQPYNQTTHGETVAAWWNARHPDSVFQPAMLPPTGIVGQIDGEICCACWLHLSAGVGVGFLENPVTAPGMAVGLARDRLRVLFAALEAIAKAHDYGVIICHALKSGRRFMESMGYAFHDFEYLTGTKLLKL